MPPAGHPFWLAAPDHLHRLGWVVLHSLWQAATVAILLAVALRLVPRRSAVGKEIRYGLTVLALFSLPVACGVTWALVEPPRTPTAAVADHDLKATATVPAVADARAAATGRHAFASSISQSFRAMASQAVTATEPWLPVCAMLWLAGAIAAAMRVAVGWSLGRRLVATAATAPDASWQARLDRWKFALGIAFPIRLVASSRVDVPIVVGWLRPVVIWPLAASTGMPPEQIDAILAHELAHVRRHDVLVNLLQSAIEAVFFHHPAAWWISAQVRAEREHCADELAIRTLATARAGSRISYATALLSLEERRQMILAAAVNGGHLGDRIRRLVGSEEASHHPARLAAAILVLAAILAVQIAVVPNGRFAEAAPPTAAKPVADEAMPQPPNRSESLTPEQARELMAALDPDEKNPLTIPAQTRLSADAAAVLAEYKGGLFLDLTTLDGETAKALATFAGKQLWLYGLMTLSTEAAAALSQFEGQRLSLPCLSTLDASVAKTLASTEAWDGDLPSLTSLDAGVAAALSEHDGGLFLGNLTRLDADAARELAKFEGTKLRVYGLNSLSADTAASLATCRAWDGSLPRLKSLDAATAKALAEFKGESLNFPGLATLDADTARGLANFQGSLVLSELTTLDTETAKALAAFKGKTLSLSGLRSLSTDAAEALAEGCGERLFIPVMEQMLGSRIALTPKTARLALAFAHCELPGVTGFETADSVAIAKILATHRGRLSLPRLQKISPKTLVALLEKTDVVIPPIETLELIQEPDGSFTEDFVIPRGFSAPQPLAQPE